MASGRFQRLLGLCGGIGLDARRREGGSLRGLRCTLLGVQWGKEKRRRGRRE